MLRLAGTVKEGALTFGVLILFWFLLYRIRRTERKTAATCCIVSLYLAAVWMLVGMPDMLYIRFDLSGNLIPFRGMIRDIKNSVLNAVLFVPFGFGLPLFRKTYRRGQKTVCAGLGMSAAIEVLQIFTHRATDVNDVITNTLGTALGFLLWKLSEMDMSVEENVGPILFGVTFGVMFFLHPVLYRIGWQIL